MFINKLKIKAKIIIFRFIFMARPDKKLSKERASERYKASKEERFLELSKSAFL